MKVYVVMVNSDLTEGRGPMKKDSIWDNPVGACKRASDLEPYHPNINIKLDKYGRYAYGQFTTVDIQDVFSSYEDKLKIENEKIKTKALAKLTAKERELLGL